MIIQVKLFFRYECEGRAAGALTGASSTHDNRTFPTIKVHGYQGPAVVVVSCVTDKEPYKAHPHNLVGKQLCKKGVCSQEVNVADMTAVFTHLGIQCVKKKDGMFILCLWCSYGSISCLTQIKVLY